MERLLQSKHWARSFQIQLSWLTCRLFNPKSFKSSLSTFGMPRFLSTTFLFSPNSTKVKASHCLSLKFSFHFSEKSLMQRETVLRRCSANAILRCDNVDAETLLAKLRFSSKTGNTNLYLHSMLISGSAIMLFQTQQPNWPARCLPPQKRPKSRSSLSLAITNSQSQYLPC